jgi:response regulator NasT
VVGEYTDVASIGQMSRTSDADVALVGLGIDDGHALDQISAIVHEAACPVIALIDAKDPAYIHEAAKRGVFAYITLAEDTHDEIQNDLDIVLRRFAEFQNLQGAFGRRAIIEQAKGILMGRDGIDADTAFQRLKTHSQETGQKLIDVAGAIVTTHQLLPPHPHGEKPPSSPDPAR